MSEISELEKEFQNEQKGGGSLSIYIDGQDRSEYVGYDINPEDLEAIYFEGIGVPRWESLSSEADTVEAQTALYWERFNGSIGAYPMIGRVRDTDERVAYDAAETEALATECEGLAAAATDNKTLRSLHKLSIAAKRAVEQDAGLEFKPSRLPNFLSGF